MKRLLSLLGMLIIGSTAWAQVVTDDEGFPTFPMTEGDTTYTMKQYIFVMLVAVPDRPELPQEELMEIQRGHMAHINKMAEEGHLAVAGPFGDDSEWRGILIFNVPSVEKVEELVSGDPAIINGRLKAEIHPWWAAQGSSLP